MAHKHERSPARFLGLLACLVTLGSAGLLAGWPEKTSAQTVSTPITRHPVLYWARQYTTYQWYWGGQHTSVPYAHKADWIDSTLGQGPDSCAAEAALFQHRLDRGCYTGCNSQAGADCSGYVMRVWGVALDQPKWDTSAIAAHSTVVPCRAGQEQCIQQAVRNEDLPRRMRMGDVFDDSGCHVVLLYYFNPNTTPPTPYYYEENGDATICQARLHSGWAYIDGTCGGWWNGADGYRPYRYNEIRDDLYLPWLSHEWYNWETTLFARNNDISPRSYVLQHTAYSGAGGDAGAINTKTYRRTNPFANDVWELPTANLQPGSFYRGGGVVAADTGDDAVVLVQAGGGYGQGLAYNGIHPFSNLGLATANTLYMPVFYYNWNGYYSKIFVQNAGKVATSITAYYYGDDGRTCSHTVGTLQPWGTAITHPEFCAWSGGNPPSSGSVRLSANQPLAAITLEHVNYVRNAGYNAFSQGSTTLYAPELLRNAWGMGWNSTLEVMNVGGGQATNIQARYYTYGGGYICTDYLSTALNPLPPNYHRSINHGGGSTCVSGYDLFSAVITSDQPIVAIANQDNATYGDFQSYNAFTRGQQGQVLPIIRKGSSPHWEDNWAASIEVQNSVGSRNLVNLSFYDQAGDYVTSRSCNLGAYASCMLLDDSQIPSPFSGSVVIEADYPVAALGSLFNINLGNDGAMKFSATEQKGRSQLGLPGEEVPTQ